MVELRILGALELLDDAGRPLPTGGTKPCLLLAALAVHAGRAVAASTLEDVLWGEAPPRTAARTLQTYVSRLRGIAARGSGLRVSTSEYGVRLEVDGGVLDADRALHLSRSADALAAAGDLAESLRLIEEALALWRGPSLAEFADEPFALAEASRLDELRLSLVERSVEHALALGHHDALTGDLEAMTKQHPLRERLWSARMLALYRCGRQAEALRCYQQLRDVLAEAGLEPSPSVRSLEAAILAQDPSLAPPGPTGSTTRSSHRRIPPGRLERALERAVHVVGRDAEIDRLQARWTEATDGRRGAVLIAGEPGIGKTTLAAVVAAEATAAGALVLYGRCDEHIRVPYKPIAEALSPHADRLASEPDDSSAVEQLWGPERDAAPEAAEAERERWLLYEGVVAALGRLAAGGAVLFVLDDLHWADEPTLLLLRHVLCAQQPQRLLVVGTYRDTDVAGAARVRRSFAEVHRDQPVEQVALGGLDAEATRALVARSGEPSVGGAPDHDLVGELRRASGGNPFFLRELLHHWPASRPAGSVLPHSVQDVILRRFDGLSQEARTVVEAVAVTGDGSSLRLLQMVLAPAMSPATVHDGIDDSVAAGLLVETEEGYGFSHAIVERTLRREMPASRRMALHKATLGAMEALGPVEDRLDALAYHACSAAADGLSGPAEQYTLAAASQAERRLAFEQAVALLERGIAALEVVPGSAAARCDLLVARASCLARHSSDRSTAIAAIDDAVKASLAMRSPRHLAEVAVVNARGLTFGDPDPAALALLDEALDGLDPEDTARRAALLAERSFVLATSGGDVEAALNASAEALRLAGADSAAVRARALHGRLSALLGAELVVEREETARELLALADMAADPAMRAMGLLHLAAVHLERGQREQFDDVAGALDAEARRTGAWYPSFFALAHRRMVALLDGRWEEAEELGPTVLQAAGDSDTALLIWAGQQVVLARDAGTAPDVVAFVQAAAEARPTVSTLRIVAATLKAGTGDDGDARAVVAEHAGGQLDLPRDRVRTLAGAFLAELVFALGDATNADRLDADLRRHQGLVVAPGGGGFCLGAIDRHLGMLASVSGRRDEAIERFEQAIQLEQGLRSQPSVARTRAVYAQALVRLGVGRPHWEPVALTARREATAARMTPLLAEIDRLMESSPRIPPPGGSSGNLLATAGA